MNTDKNLFIIILILVAVIGYQYFIIEKRKRENIIKLVIKKDVLPAPASGTTWIKGGSCFMKDGKVGTVEGNDCVMIEVI